MRFVRSHSAQNNKLLKTGVGNLSLVAGQKETLQGVASRINFPPTIPFPLLSWCCWNLWIYGILIRLTKAQNATYSTFIAQCGCS